MEAHSSFSSSEISAQNCGTIDKRCWRAYTRISLSSSCSSASEPAVRQISLGILWMHKPALVVTAGTGMVMIMDLRRSD